MCHGLFPFLAFRLLGFLRAAPTRGLFLFYLRFRSLAHFACYCFDLGALSRSFCLSYDWKYLFLFFPGFGSRTCNQALATGNNIVDRKNSEFLTMSPAMTNTLLRFVPENNQLFAATLLCGSCQHHSIIHEWSAYHGVVGIRDQQYLIKMNLLTDFNWKPVDLKRLADGNLVLSSTTFNYCKHDFCHSPFPSPR